jgi:hypothetical protein
MRMKILCAGLLALPVAASAQLTEIPEFTGEFSEGFEGATPGMFTPCVEPSVFDGQADLCSELAHVTGGWGFRCSIPPQEGTRFYGSANPGTASTYTFSEPVTRFGGWFGTNALLPGEPTDGGRVEFYDEFGALIGDPQVLQLDDICGWHWHGWESDVPVFEVIARNATPFGEGFLMMDGMQIDLFVGGTECYADCDESGELDFFDFLCFQNAFAAGEEYADCDGSGELDFFDFLCFQNEFAAGCP